MALIIACTNAVLSPENPTHWANICQVLQTSALNADMSLSLVDEDRLSKWKVYCSNVSSTCKSEKDQRTESFGAFTTKMSLLPCRVLRKLFFYPMRLTLLDFCIALKLGLYFSAVKHLDKVENKQLLLKAVVFPSALQRSKVRGHPPLYAVRRTSARDNFPVLHEHANSPRWIWFHTAMFPGEFSFSVSAAFSVIWREVSAQIASCSISSLEGETQTTQSRSTCRSWKLPGEKPIYQQSAPWFVRIAWSLSCSSELWEIMSAQETELDLDRERSW